MVSGWASLLAIGGFIALAAATSAQRSAAPAPAKGPGGTIKGHIRLAGASPGNVVIRMGKDPMCAKATAGTRPIQESARVDASGNLENVFVKLEGAFPSAAARSGPVAIDQRGCLYSPRVSGVQIGQTLQIRNSDNWMHNVHSISSKGNEFNFSQPSAGLMRSVPLKGEETMLRLRCDVHSWMTAYVGVVSHPYFAVSGVGGTFEIANVPPGTQTVQGWHELFGTETASVRVRPGAATAVELTFNAAAKPGAP